MEVEFRGTINGLHLFTAFCHGGISFVIFCYCRARICLWIARDIPMIRRVILVLVSSKLVLITPPKIIVNHCYFVFFKSHISLKGGSHDGWMIRQPCKQG